MDFAYTEPQTELEGILGGYFHISLFGAVEIGDDHRFEKFLERSDPPPRIDVYINSVGGNVQAAMGIGRLIRARGFATSVGTYTLDPKAEAEPIVSRKFAPGNCLSAATLIYVSGVIRHMDERSKFGVHQFSFKNPSPEDLVKSQKLSAAVARYIEDMGIPAAFLEQSAMTPGHDLSLLSGDQLRSLKVVTDGVIEASWTVEMNQNATWVKAERDSMFGHGKLLLIYSPSDGFSFAAFVEAMGHERELLNFSLLEIGLGEDGAALDVSDRCLRVPSGIYIMFMAKLSEAEARVIAFSANIGFVVRASAGAEVFLGIAPVSTKGGEDKLKGLFRIGSR